MPMTPDAKNALSRTIRALRTRLLDDLHAATEGAYRLSLDAKDAKLGEAARIKRQRLESWTAEQVRALPEKERTGAEDRFRLEVEKDAASTLLNRIVFLRLLEASDLREENVAIGGWESRGYKDFREFAPELVRRSESETDETEGYAQLLQLIFDDLAIDLPGLYGNVRLTALIPVPAATLRAVVEALDAPALESCWADDMTFGWIYQYWNDPEREAIDVKVKDGGKVEPHEIASKTQMFTERYMVDWMLQNSLGPMWLTMCTKQGWKPEVEADGTLARLEERRIEWRAKREAGEASLTELMPLESDAEKLWVYYVPQPIPDYAVKHSNGSVRDLKILDPAVGSGHFLVVAFDLLFAMYREEARHRGEEGESLWADKSIVEMILENNLHGIDLDPRAVQITAAALWLKAMRYSRVARPRHFNLVASNLRLSRLSTDDPARSQLRELVERETGIPQYVTKQLLDALAGADHLGSLLKIDKEIDEALVGCEENFSRLDQAQSDLFREVRENRRVPIGLEEAKASLLSRLEYFLHEHSHAGDIGLKFNGEQLTAGVRFVRMLRKSAYDLVVANPPYLGARKMVDPNYIAKNYSLGKTDLYAAFLIRGLELVRPGGIAAMLTLRNWMFTQDYEDFRPWMLSKYDLRIIGDLDWGAFTEMKDVKVAISIFYKGASSGRTSISIAPTGPFPSGRTIGDYRKKQAGLLVASQRFEFDSAELRVVPEWPLVYWWDEKTLAEFSQNLTIGDRGRVSQGISTTVDGRFFRRPWELCTINACRTGEPLSGEALARFVPLIKGAAGSVWIEPLDYACAWAPAGLAIRTIKGSAFRSPETHFLPGVAYAAIGASFRARWHRYRSVCQNMGTSIFELPLAEVTCAMNSKATASLAQSLNPGVHFEVGDAKRLPFRPTAGAERIASRLEEAFTQHESRREASVEFQSPGPSPWRHVQDWAQLAVDRHEDAPLPTYVDEFDPKPSADYLSFALGVSLGRFDADGKGILDPSIDNLSAALPSGICFLDGSLVKNAIGDSLGHGASELMKVNWAEHGLLIEPSSDLRTWLRLKYFGDVHKGMYDNRPIYFPLSSAKKTFVAYVSIHRWTEDTLRALLAEHLYDPALTRLEGEIADLREARQSADKKIARDAEGRYDQVTKWKQELGDFIALVEQCAEKGPLAPDAKTPEREVDARYVPVLDDGVMINSGALWPLLEPQWKDPKKWWKELAIANPKGKKDYDWSHLSARYFPSRVDKKCQEDPSLGVAHGCFWKYHPENAYKWELRLQDEIAPDFTIDEEGSDAAREAFEEQYPEKVEELIEAERKRRERNKKKQEKEAGEPEPFFEIDKEPVLQDAISK